MSKDPAARGRQSGFSLVEAMVAALLLLLIAVGILPLFVQSITNNAQALDSTNAANFARERIEEFLQLPWEDTRLEIQAGTERSFDEIYLFNARKWIDGTVPPAGDWALWGRRTLIHQYSANSLTAPPLSYEQKLPASTPPGSVHLKEIEVIVKSFRNRDATGFSFGAGKTVAARVYKAM